MFLKHSLHTMSPASIHPPNRIHEGRTDGGWIHCTFASIMFIFCPFLPPAFFFLPRIFCRFYFWESFLHFPWSAWVISQYTPEGSTNQYTEVATLIGKLGLSVSEKQFGRNLEGKTPLHSYMFPTSFIFIYRAESIVWNTLSEQIHCLNGAGSDTF